VRRRLEEAVAVVDIEQLVLGVEIGDQHIEIEVSVDVPEITVLAVAGGIEIG